MKIKIKLISAIERSQRAYEDYRDDKKYFKALRIYNANKEVHRLLEKYLYKTSSEKRETVTYIFHLEDWFAQFEVAVQKNKPQLADLFLFDRLLGSIAYPKEFYENLNSNT